MKVWVKMHFLQDPPKGYIFCPNSFLYALPKKPRNLARNKELLATHDFYFIFKAFFSQMNNKGFFLVIDPLNLNLIL